MMNTSSIVDSDTDSWVEYEGKKIRDLEEIKPSIDFSLIKLKDKYSVQYSEN